MSRELSTNATTGHGAKLEEVGESTAHNTPAIKTERVDFEDAIASGGAAKLKDGPVTVHQTKHAESEGPVAEISAGCLLDFIKSEIKSEPQEMITEFKVVGDGNIIIKYTNTESCSDVGNCGGSVVTKEDEPQDVISPINTNGGKNPSSLNDHRNDSLPFECKHCQFKTIYKFYLELHRQRKHHIEQKHFLCPTCGAPYSHRKTLRRHIRSEHSTSSQLFCCTTCDFSTQKYKMLRYHWKTNHGKLLECECCDFKSFHRGSILQHKLRKHSGAPKPLSCETCNKRFHTKAELKSHLLVHTGLRPHACTFCCFSATSTRNLRRHYNIKHSNERSEIVKPFVCSICKKRFKEELECKKHSKTHYYNCPHCEFETTRKIDLKKHCLAKHTITDQLHCETCNKRFSSQSKLKRHVAVHAAKYRCSECNFECKMKGSLEHHKLLKHTSEINCHACNERFLNHASLERHLRYCVFN